MGFIAAVKDVREGVKDIGLETPFDFGDEALVKGSLLEFGMVRRRKSRPSFQ